MATIISSNFVNPSSPIVAAVIKEITATGPTARALEVPKIPYAINGAIDAYNPISEGSPAKSAYARDCGINMTVTIIAAIKSSLSAL